MYLKLSAFFTCLVYNKFTKVKILELMHMSKSSINNNKGRQTDFEFDSFDKWQTAKLTNDRQIVLESDCNQKYNKPRKMWLNHLILQI